MIGTQPPEPDVQSRSMQLRSELQRGSQVQVSRHAAHEQRVGSLPKQ